MRLQYRSIALAALLASTSLGTAFAQPQAGTAAASTTTTASGPQAEGRATGGPRFDPARREAQRAQQAEVLKAKLRITPQQEPAWNAFNSALRPAPRDAAAARPDRAEFAKLTTPQRIDRMREARARHAAEADRRDEAVKTFYAALTPAQQQTFDALPPTYLGRHAMGHGPHHGRGGPERGPRPGMAPAAGGEGQPPVR